MNKFGKLDLFKQYQPTADINAGAIFDFAIAQDDIDNYSPFANIKLFNGSSNDIMLAIDGGGGVASGEFGAGKKTYYVPAYALFQMIYRDDKTLFSRVSIKNLGADAIDCYNAGATPVEPVILEISNEASE